MITSVLSEAAERCFGCGACEQVCPHQAISMCADAEGFLFPRVDPDLCVGCDLCVRVCPALPENRDRTLNLPQHVYAAWRKDHQQLMQSTSGGLCALISENVISQGGIVYGCAWAENDLRAIHIRIDNLKELDRLKHSKYVQSSTENTFKEVLNDLKQNRYVLYTGTPCQIAGLKLFLKRDYENLLTIDLVCHGVPSPKMFAAYVYSLERREKGRIFDFKFRDKRESGYRAYLSYRCPKRDKKYILVGLSSYFKGFSDGIFDRESCFSCSFASPRRTGDFTLGDYWGIELSHPELALCHKYGVSLCFLNTQKAVDLQKKLTAGAEFIPSSLQSAQKKNPTLSAPPASRPPLRDQVYSDLDNYGFDYLAQHYLRPRHAWLRRLIPARVKNLLRSFKRK
jgi:coenzyme F420-reducing hydrogenase beta subunit